MRAGFIAVIAGAASLTACAGAQPPGGYHTMVNSLGQPGFQKLELSKAALGATPIILWRNAAINPDCTEVAGVTLKVIKEPEHGAVTVTDGPMFVAYPPANPRSVCNSRKIPAHEATYQAQAGYTGHDSVVLQGSSPEGHVREIHIDIDVR